LLLSVASPPNVLNPALRPEPGESVPDVEAKAKTAKTALAALIGAPAPASSQDSFDALAERLADDWQPSLSPLIDPVRELLARCATLEEFRARLPELVEAMDTGPLVDTLAQALFAAHLTGRIGNG
jgi:phage gp29-like protein